MWRLKFKNVDQNQHICQLETIVEHFLELFAVFNFCKSESIQFLIARKSWCMGKWNIQQSIISIISMAKGERILNRTGPTTAAFLGTTQNE